MSFATDVKLLIFITIMKQSVAKIPDKTFFFSMTAMFGSLHDNFISKPHAIRTNTKLKYQMYLYMVAFWGSKSFT